MTKLTTLWRPMCKDCGHWRFKHMGEGVCQRYPKEIVKKDSGTCSEHTVYLMSINNKRDFLEWMEQQGEK